MIISGIGRIVSLITKLQLIKEISEANPLTSIPPKVCAITPFLVPVNGDQVSIITSALAESSGRIRRLLHGLLARCRLASPSCLVSLLDGLLTNLRRYPRDRFSLWQYV
ncbi:unnamed protein product [Protopolystoma xenopodis]|uniref:Uncharacterized protein n=1 Tax=Protopolystoma xenopodis TaxID=117903 RepID=A0A3S5CPU0_9PLAT|nr:unnamed protein product [Protopolystoma xenopodis]